jgi:hypothetical protein
LPRTAASRGIRESLSARRRPLKVKDIWAIRVRLQIQGRTRDLALFDLGIDSKLRGCDLVKLRVRVVCHGDRGGSRAICFSRRRNGQCSSRSRPRRETPWRHGSGPRHCGRTTICFRARLHGSPHLGARQYGRIVYGWVKELGLDPAGYGTHSIRRTKPTLIYRRTRNLRAVQLLLGTRSWKAP